MKKEFLNLKAKEISKKFKGEPPVVIVVGGIGTREDRFEPKSMLWGVYNASRLRERVGILQTAIQKDSYEHHEAQKKTPK